MITSLLMFELHYKTTWNILTKHVTQQNHFVVAKLKSSHWRCSIKEAVLKNFTKFTAKYLHWSVFLIKLQASRKKNFQHRCFLVNSAKFLTHFLKNSSDGCFCINTCWVYCPTTTFRLFKNDETYIFRLSSLQTGNNPLGTRRKLNVHKTFRTRRGRLLNILCTLNLRFVSREKSELNISNPELGAYFQPSRKSATELFLRK